jgi:hypothetical protein
LERLSPMPVTQVVWSLQILPHPEPNMQTVIVILAPRNVVEEFLGKLESEGFLADRLDLPVLDQLQARTINQDGVWIYPAGIGDSNTALAAWWCQGILQNLDLLTLPATQRGTALREQLLQMRWSGELEGWLTGAPQWTLVAEPAAASDWEPALREALEQPLEVQAPAPAAQLAAQNAQRAAQNELQSNLLPAEYVTRYHQRFVDRLWMRGLAGVLGLYLICLLVYLIALGFASYRTRDVEKQVARVAPAYTNAMQLKARYQVLKDRQELKYAALDCYQLVAEHLPADATLEALSFSDGRKLALNGTASADKIAALLDFEPHLRKALVNGQPFFDPALGDNLSYRQNPGAPLATWSMTLELKRTEDQ